jgi:hypothetical protein
LSFSIDMSAMGGSFAVQVFSMRRRQTRVRYAVDMRMAFTFLTLGLLVSTLACNGNTTTEETFVDVGRACISGAADEPHSIEVDFPTCLSSSCDSVVESMCEATLSGTQLTINATATISMIRPGPCTLDCQPVLVTCETDPLPAGSYDLVFGDVQGTLTVPAATADPTCIGEPPE